ncbi:hypothetical protein AURDEDRAFT_159670 [Auricularia subglabra TFB-10046 SS5]|nr:hypothetical protein AURDEDRAFT_159670 [Auricularia subglabra TFB-10046 SS5]
MQVPITPSLPTILLPMLGASLPRGINVNGPRRTSPRAVPAPGPSVHATLVYGVFYDFASRAFTTPNDSRPLASITLDAPAALPLSHQPTAAVSFVGHTATVLISCPAPRQYISVRDILEAIDIALQRSHHAVRPGRVVRVHVQSPSVGDYRVSLFKHS